MSSDCSPTFHSHSVNNYHSAGCMHSKGHNTQAVLTVLVLEECPEHGLEIGFVRQLSDLVAWTQALDVCFQYASYAAAGFWPLYMLNLV